MNRKKFIQISSLGILTPVVPNFNIITNPTSEPNDYVIITEDSPLIWNIIGRIAIGVAAGVITELVTNYIKNLTKPEVQTTCKLPHAVNKHITNSSIHINVDNSPVYSQYPEYKYANSIRPEYKDVIHRDYIMYKGIVTKPYSNQEPKNKVCMFHGRNSKYHICDLGGADAIGMGGIKVFSGKYGHEAARDYYLPRSVVHMSNSDHWNRSYSQKTIFKTNQGGLSIYYRVTNSNSYNCKGVVSVEIESSAISEKIIIETEYQC